MLQGLFCPTAATEQRKAALSAAPPAQMPLAGSYASRPPSLSLSVFTSPIRPVRVCV